MTRKKSTNQIIDRTSCSSSSSFVVAMSKAMKRKKRKGKERRNSAECTYTTTRPRCDTSSCFSQEIQPMSMYVSSPRVFYHWCIVTLQFATTNLIDTHSLTRAHIFSTLSSLDNRYRRERKDERCVFLFPSLFFLEILIIFTNLWVGLKKGRTNTQSALQHYCLSFASGKKHWYRHRHEEKRDWHGKVFL